MSRFHLGREALVQRVLDAACRYDVTIVNSPAGTGKTSLLTLLTRREPNCIRIWCTHGPLWLEHLKQYGIDLEKPAVSIPKEGPRLLLLLDDAQRAYHNNDAWGFLIKSGMIPKRVHILICATHALSTKGDSPEVFASISSRFGRSDMLLCDEEADKLLKSEFGLPRFAHKHSNLLHAIKRDCGGHAAALAITADAISSMGWDACKSSDGLDEETMLAMFYSHRVTIGLDRCFGNEISAPDGVLIQMLQKCLFQRDPLVSRELDEAAQKACRQLVKTGILVGSSEYRFATRMAERYFYKYIFPHRATKNPETLKDLMLAAVQSLSASQLRLSINNVGAFPKEATFQHLLMCSLCELTKVDCYVCPELSRSFDQEVIDGEVNFYLDGELRWGIELLVQGRGVGEHIERFGDRGKYAPLNVKDYVVVDFRYQLGGTVQRHPKRITVLFSDDLSACDYIHGHDPEIKSLQLKA